MKKFFNKIVNHSVDSLHVNAGGFSARKITAFITVICIIYIHIRFVNPANALDVLLYDMGFVLILLGIVTIDQLYRFKSGVTNTVVKIEEVKPTPPVVQAIPIVTTATTINNTTVVSDGPPTDMNVPN